MSYSTLPSKSQVSSFMGSLVSDLPDCRDTRGKRHHLAFVVAAVAIALASMCRTMSSVHRFIVERFVWLREATGMCPAKPVSRAHLPRLLGLVDLTALNELILEHFNARPGATGWYAVDGKVLRGSSRNGGRQAVVIAVSHDSSVEVGRHAQSGLKSSEIPVVRELLADIALEAARVTMDAMHCNPETLEQVQQAGGTYLTQVKENQPEMLCKAHAYAMQEPTLSKTRIPRRHTGASQRASLSCSRCGGARST
ncbi:MAG TPA: ISAs1 family transposase, partial [Burkholderiaceae bacterium]